MIKIFTVITLFLSTLAFGQVTKKTEYTRVVGLTIIDSISWQDIVGGFVMSDGFGGYNFQLDSNMTFKEIEFDCVSKIKVDSGSWTIRNHNTVVLKSNKQALLFDIVKFDAFYFFILPKQRRKFIEDLRATKIKLKKFRPFAIDNRTYLVDYLIGYSLTKKYYAKEIEQNVGGDTSEQPLPF